MSLIRLEQVNKTYKTADTVYTALKNINLTLQKGEMTAVVGKSGSGKSTLMHILGFLDTCTSGSYYFADKHVSMLTDDELATIRNQQIGFVFQSFFLLQRSTVIENVMLPLSYRGIEKNIAREKANSLLHKVGMVEHANKYPNQLSGGQQQRVAIARALVGDPAIILADEPTGALDTQTGEEIMRLFHQLNQDEDRTILIITHDLSISHQCRRVIEIQDGCIKQESD